MKIIRRLAKYLLRREDKLYNFITTLNTSPRLRLSKRL
jgi:hypothetical protein